MKKLLIVLCITLVSSGFMNAQDSIGWQKNPILTKKIYIYAGAFAPLKKVRFGFEGTAPVPYKDLIDVDKTFDLEGIQPTFNANVHWRFSKNWSMNADYFSLRTRNTVVLPRDIVWDKYTLKKGSTVEGGYGVSVLKIGFGRAISRGLKHELEGLVGIYILSPNGFVSGLAYVNEEEFFLDRSEISVTLPLPSIGLKYLYAPTRTLSFFARAEWFGIKVDGIEGSLWSLSPGVQFQFSRYIGARLSYKYLNLIGNVDTLNWNGSFELLFNGPSLGLTASF